LPARRVSTTAKVTSALGLVSVATALGLWLRNDPPVDPVSPPEPVSYSPEELLPAPLEPPTILPAEVEERALVAPTGEPPAIDCDGARKIVAQARTGLAVPADAVDAEKFAAAVSDWLDPHGLWSVAPDAPIARVLAANDLAHDIEAAPGSGKCEAALAVGNELARWVGDLRGEIVGSRAGARRSPTSQRRHRFELASSTPFEDGAVTKRGRELARGLGQRIGSLEAAFGPGIEGYTAVAAERLAPEKDPEQWAQIVLAAAVRAYVPQIDPHGAWAPLDEEASIYDVDLEVDPPPRLWGEMTRTVLGVRIDRGALAPLRDGDVVLRVGKSIVGGMSVEQANQLSFLPHGDPMAVTVLRGDSAAPIDLEVETHVELLAPPPSGMAATGLATSRVSYAGGYALVVKVPDVPDDLGERVMAALAVEDASADGKERLGVLLDLRGNGGGSTDGALGAIGVFLPGATLFPMRRRDGEIAVDRAPRLPADAVWTGPVAALVDGESASAAEMIAGALAAYGRGLVLGSRTYGKGCAQEYLDDEAGVGVLRLTTLVFALPDGTPVQRVGVVPHVALGLPAGLDREEALPRAPNTWSGPDVRSPELVKEVAWPDHGGKLGQADDPVIYRALRALGTTRVAARSFGGAKASGR
jgi:carboxyl-terminal processing protease